MLTIKKRFPSQKLFLYGGVGLVLGYAGMLSLLVHNNTSLSRFASPAPEAPVIERPVQKERSPSDGASADNSVVQNPLVWSAPSSQPTPKNSEPSQPASTEPTPTTPAEPTDPTTPTDPETPVDPTPDPEPEPTDPLDPIIDILLP